MGGGEEEEAQARSETDGSKRKLDDIQLAKQKAQEIVARLVNDAETKRPRLDVPSDSFSAPPPPFPDVAQKLSSEPTGKLQTGSAPFAAQPGAYYGSQGSCKKIEIPNGKVGVIIGKAGETIKQLQLQSGARIQVTKDSEADLYSQTRGVELSGTPEQISSAEQLIKNVIAETDAGGSGSSAARGMNSVPPGAEQFVMKVPNNKVAVIIGKGGENIKNMQSRSGARIQVIPLHLPPGDTSTERNVYINGTNEQIEMAKELVNEVISENRVRNPSMQQNYRTPTNWGPGPQSTPQPAYGYSQPGAYPPPPPSYYGSYPPQQAGWEQSNPSGQPQQSTGYNYYGQMSQSGSGQAGVDYGYGQTPPASSTNYDQGYSQQSQSYGQDASPQVAQHDPQKSYQTPGYAQPAASSQLDGTIHSQPYGAPSSTQPPPAYQASYSQPPTVPPAVAYISPQGYPGTLPSQPAYDQSGYAQSGYGGQPPVLTAQPMTQPVYGQSSYPPQPPPAQSSYPQGTSPFYGYGQMPLQTPPQPQPTMYMQPLAYGAERNGDKIPAVPPSNVTASAAAQEPVRPQS